MAGSMKSLWAPGLAYTLGNRKTFSRPKALFRAKFLSYYGRPSPTLWKSTTLSKLANRKVCFRAWMAETPSPAFNFSIEVRTPNSRTQLFLQRYAGACAMRRIPCFRFHTLNVRDGLVSA